MTPIDIYVRVSRVGGREHLISPELQETRCRHHAAGLGLTVGEVLRDIDHSGGTLDRPELQRALDRVRAGQSGGLIVGWLDRLSRDSEAGKGHRPHDHRSRRAHLRPGRAGRLHDTRGRATGRILFEFAQYTRSRAKAGFAKAQARAVEQGIAPGATTPPIGYVKGADRRFAVDPATAPMIREGVRAPRGRRRYHGARTHARSCRHQYRPGLGYVVGAGGPPHHPQSDLSRRGEVRGARQPRNAHEPLVDFATCDRRPASQRRRAATITERRRIPAERHSPLRRVRVRVGGHAGVCQTWRAAPCTGARSAMQAASATTLRGRRGSPSRR